MSAAFNGISMFFNIRGMLISILSENFSTFVSEDKDLEIGLGQYTLKI